jgi:hypothetical protein
MATAVLRKNAHMNSPRRITALVLLAPIALASLAGCAAQSHTAGPSQPTTIASLSGVIATGTLVSEEAAHPISGRVSVVANPSTHALTLTLTGLTGDTSPVAEVLLSTEFVKPGSACEPGGIAYSAGSITTSANQRLTMPSDGSPGWVNPSFFHDLIFRSKVFPTADGCASDMVAYAPLTWTVGDVRPDIHVVDRGARTGAMGSTNTTDGKPTAYRVVAGDYLDAIAARFHLSLNDLFYLNPARYPSPLSLVVETGEVLNLSKSNR